MPPKSALSGPNSVINPTPEDYAELQNPREEASYTKFYRDLDPDELIPVYQFSTGNVYESILDNSPEIENFNYRQERVDRIRHSNLKTPNFRKIPKEELESQSTALTSEMLPDTKNNINKIPDKSTNINSNTLEKLGFFNLPNDNKSKLNLPQTYLRPDFNKDQLTRGKLMYNSKNFQVQYDMDETDLLFINWINEIAKENITMEQFEIIITFIEIKLYQIERLLPPTIKDRSIIDYQQQHHALLYGSDDGTGFVDQDEQACAVCESSECDSTNSIIFCDGCDIAVHQDCYGVSFIPEGPWLCRRCLIARNTTEKCLFCPSTTGAFKQTDSGDWAHVLCTLWTPELYFANPIYMEPVEGVMNIPKSRWKLNCYICKQKMGVCIQCSKPSCFAAYHVTCAKRAGFYMKFKKGVKAAVDNKNTLVSYCDKHTPNDWKVNHNVINGIEKTRLYFHDKSRDSLQNDVNNELTFVTNEEYDELIATNSNDFKWRYNSNVYIVPSIIIDQLIEFIRLNKLPEIARVTLNQIAKYYSLKRNHIGKPLIKRPDVLNHASIPESILTKRDATIEFFQKDVSHLHYLSKLIVKRTKLCKSLVDEKLEAAILLNNPKQWVFNNLVSYFKAHFVEIENSTGISLPSFPKYAVKPTIYQIIENANDVKYESIEDLINDIENFSNWILNVNLNINSPLNEIQKLFRAWQRYKKAKYQNAREYYKLVIEQWGNLKSQFVQEDECSLSLAYTPSESNIENGEFATVPRKRKRKNGGKRMGIDISQFENGDLTSTERHLRTRKSAVDSDKIEEGKEEDYVDKPKNVLKARLDRVKQRTNVQNLRKTRRNN